MCIFEGHRIVPRDEKDDGLFGQGLRPLLLQPKPVVLLAGRADQLLECVARHEADAVDLDCATHPASVARVVVRGLQEVVVHRGEHHHGGNVTAAEQRGVGQWEGGAGYLR